MTESIFADCNELDIEFLNDTYADDVETAILLFRQFLSELPKNTQLLRNSLLDNDISAFRKHLHKQKPAFSFVGLTGITTFMHDLQSKCLATLDLSIYRREIEEMLVAIDRSAGIIEIAISKLEAQL
jgi:HPt (histidine-containing phosphotransfer) domain-containing protein